MIQRNGSSGTCGLDAGRAGRSLHDAVRAVRDTHPRLPSLWAAYLHVGA